MPAEARRLRRRITRRDRWFIVAVVSAAVVATPTAVLLSEHGSTRGTDARCVSTIRAFIMGAATFRYCGADAAVACRRFASRDSGLAAQCERIGLAPRR